MNYQAVYEYLIQHNGGTFDANGDNLEDCKLYAVAVFPEFSFKVPRLTRPLIARVFSRYRREFDDPHDEALGFWHNPEEKLWYIEAVFLFTDRDTAEVYARYYGQVAYYHLDCAVPVEERCIYVKEKS